MNVITARERISPFTNKLSIWITVLTLDQATTLIFHNLKFAMEKYRYPLSLKKKFLALWQSLNSYLQPGEVSISQGWMQNPFIFKLKSMDGNDGMTKDLVEIKPEKNLNGVPFNAVRYLLVHATQRFPNLAKTALEVLVTFATNYLCESGFSTLLHIKTKARNNLESGDDVQIRMYIMEHLVVLEYSGIFVLNPEYRILFRNNLLGAKSADCTEV